MNVYIAPTPTWFLALYFHSSGQFFGLYKQWSAANKQDNVKGTQWAMGNGRKRSRVAFSGKYGPKYADF